MYKLTKKDIEKIISTFENISDIQELSDEDFAEIKISKFVQILSPGWPNSARGKNEEY